MDPIIIAHAKVKPILKFPVKFDRGFIECEFMSFDSK